MKNQTTQNIYIPYYITEGTCRAGSSTCTVVVARNICTSTAGVVGKVKYTFTVSEQEG
jgi:hypothetical protein